MNEEVEDMKEEAEDINKALEKMDEKAKIYSDKIYDFKNEFFRIQDKDKDKDEDKFFSSKKQVKQFISDVKTASESDEWILENQTAEESFKNFNKGLRSFIVDYPNIARFFMYKIYSKNFDCDVAKKALDDLKSVYLSNNIYKDYNYEIKPQKKNSKKYEIQICEKNQKKVLYKYRGDTMNSFWQLFKSFMQNCLKDKDELDLRDSKSKINNNSLLNKNVPKDKRLFKKKDTYNYNIKNWIHHFIVNYNKIESSEKKSILKQFDEFAYLTHTIGNFLLIPYVEGLGDNNYNNAKQNKFNDSFILSLYDIKNVFNKEINSGIINPKNIYWLKNFKSYDDFIEKNKLNCFDETMKYTKLYDYDYCDNNNHNHNNNNKKYVFNFFEDINVIQYNIDGIYSTCDLENNVDLSKLNSIAKYLESLNENIKTRNK